MLNYETEAAMPRQYIRDWALTTNSPYDTCSVTRHHQLTVGVLAACWLLIIGCGPGPLILDNSTLADVNRSLREAGDKRLMMTMKNQQFPARAYHVEVSAKTVYYFRTLKQGARQFTVLTKHVKRIYYPGRTKARKGGLFGILPGTLGFVAVAATAPDCSGPNEASLCGLKSAMGGLMSIGAVVVGGVTGVMIGGSYARHNKQRTVYYRGPVSRYEW